VSSVADKILTAEDLLKLPRGRFRYELIEGELKQMSPAGHDRGRIAMELSAPLHQYVKANNLGKVYAAETGFLLKTDPDTVRAPDIAFIRQERVAEVGRSKGYWRDAPDLAVEVMSPSDSVGKLEDKIQMWIEAGTRLVWVISPKLGTVTVYRSLMDIQTLTEKDVLDGGDVVQGFKFPVAELFAV
jgi:Uma2 family endonuclease